jgi:hypothetical protein
MMDIMGYFGENDLPSSMNNGAWRFEEEYRGCRYFKFHLLCMFSVILSEANNLAYRIKFIFAAKNDGFHWAARTL